MKFEVPFVRQTLNNSCCIASLAMLLKFYGERFGKKPDRELISKFRLSKTRPIYVEQIIWIAAQLTYSSALHTRFKEYYGKTRAKVIKNIQKAIKFWKPGRLEKRFWGTVPKNEVWGIPILKAVKSRKCTILNRPPTVYTLRKYLDKNIPVIVVLDWNITYNVKGKLESHAVVVNGYDKKYFYILDPRKGRKAIPKNNFIKAWSTTFSNRYLFVLRRKHVT